MKKHNFYSDVERNEYRRIMRALDRHDESKGSRRFLKRLAELLSRGYELEEAEMLTSLEVQASVVGILVKNDRDELRQNIRRLRQAGDYGTQVL